MSIGKDFIEGTKFKHLGISHQSRGEKMPPFESPPPDKGERIKLPQVSGVELPAIDLTVAISRRRSIRKFAPHPLTLEELAYLLWITQGIREVIPGSATLRTVPSAGARHAIDTYLLINNITGLKPGLYRYLVLENSLIPFDLSPDIQYRVSESCLGQNMVYKAGCTFIWAADIYRMTWRYGERGYRYIFLDAGHICQNLYLGVETIGCGACAVAAFSDEDLNALLNIDGENRFALYLAAVGKK